MIDDVPDTVLVDPDLERLARRLLELVARATGLETTYLTRIDLSEDVQHVLVSRSSGEIAIGEGLQVPWHDTLCQRALATGTTRSDDVPAAFADCDAAIGLGIRTYVMVPVLDVEGAVYGTLCGASAARVPVNDDAYAVMVALGEMITMQLRDRAARSEIARQAEDLAVANTQLRHLALTDELTGLANRRALLESLEHLGAAARRSGQPLAVVSIDVDRFKGINDRFGHAAGDEVLVRIAGALRSVVRGQDVVGRIGGDEFLVLLPETDADGAAALAARMVQQCASLELPDGSCASVSVGVASGDGTGDADMLLQADWALYAAKGSAPVR
ncbi:MAG TPA: sensor domain-containing diguanylate cyclase [Acidimicrobiales bacterium]|nr:sensor domain-containing diguanylate cyclase [Acidimicrobiales bacterium]